MSTDPFVELAEMADHGWEVVVSTLARSDAWVATLTRSVPEGTPESHNAADEAVYGWGVRTWEHTGRSHLWVSVPGATPAVAASAALELARYALTTLDALVRTDSPVVAA